MTDAEPPLDDAAALAAWMIAQGWHEAVGTAAIDHAMWTLERLVERHGEDQATAVFREALHRIKYRDGSATCPRCSLMPRLVVGRQGFCGNDDCAVFMWDLAAPDGGMSNPGVIDLEFGAGEGGDGRG